MSVSFKKKMPLAEGLLIASELEAALHAHSFTVQICGSIRRRKPEIGDIDVVVNGDMAQLRDGGPWLFAEGGERKVTLEFQGQQVNVLHATPDNWGAAILYFTGSQQHNIIMRAQAKRKGFKLNEYGLWQEAHPKSWNLIAGMNESDIYAALGLQFKPPEAR